MRYAIPIIRRVCTIGLILLTLGACGAPSATPAATQAPATNVATESVGLSDPFAYCASVGTIDAPDARYTGDPIPDSLVQGMVAKGLVTADAPAEFKRNAVWRCMQGKLWICHFGANLPCQEKADTSKVPTPAMEEFCKANPAADSIPAAVTGRATVYAWGCSDGEPAVVSTSFTVDPQGYLTELWYELTP